MARFEFWSPGDGERDADDLPSWCVDFDDAGEAAAEIMYEQGFLDDGSDERVVIIRDTETGETQRWACSVSIEFGARKVSDAT